MQAKDVLDALVKEFDLQEERDSGDLDLSSILYYDPTSSHGGKPGKKWVELFQKTRERWLKGEEEVAIAQKRWRLEKLEEGVRKFLTAGNYLGAAQLMEQAAKETGGKYTNDHHVDHGGEVGVSGGVVFTAPGQPQSPPQTPPPEEE